MTIDISARMKSRAAGMKRHLMVGLVIGLVWALLSLAYAPVTHAATFTVDSQTDAIGGVTAVVDDNPGDGICATAPLPGEGVRCTLRAAIMEANALPGPDT